MNLSLRKVTIKDLLILYKWANDRSVRSNSINRKKILLESHSKWLKKMIDSRNNFFYIAQIKSIPVGTTRIEKKKNLGYLSYLVDIKFRRKGIGYLMLIKFLKKIFKKFPNLKIIALVIKKNLVSKKIFKKIGFKILKTNNKTIYFKLTKSELKL